MSQYVEVVPTAGGGGIPRSPGGGGGGLTSSQARNDARLGQAGKLLVAVVQATTPASAGNLAAGLTGASGGAASRADPIHSATSNGPHAELSAAASSPISSVLAAAAGSGQSGLGLVLLGLLLAAALGVAAGAVLRQRALRRRASGS